MVTVIIPAYNASKYIDECLASLKDAGQILVGVDACQNTYSHLKNTSGIELFYFPKSVGPFAIKNTLIDEAKYDKILFFDADDVLAEGVINKIDKLLDEVDVVKLNYINFQNKPTTNGHMMYDALMAINKNAFNNLKGFYTWRCGADTELHHRIAYNKLKTKLLDGLGYHRRLHGENLTMRKDTGHGSSIRNSYVNIIARNQASGHWPNPEDKIKEQYDKDTTTP